MLEPWFVVVLVHAPSDNKEIALRINLGPLAGFATREEAIKNLKIICFENNPEVLLLREVTEKEWLEHPDHR